MTFKNTPCYNRVPSSRGSAIILQPKAQLVPLMIDNYITASEVVVTEMKGASRKREKNVLLRWIYKCHVSWWSDKCFVHWQFSFYTKRGNAEKNSKSSSSTRRRTHVTLWRTGGLFTAQAYFFFTSTAKVCTKVTPRLSSLPVPYPVVLSATS